MPLIFTIAGSYLSGWIIQFIKIVPWQVWVIVGAVVAALIYGQVQHHRGYAVCEAEVKVANDKEVAREKQITDAATQSALELASRNAANAAKNAEARDALQVEVDHLKTAAQVCLPGSITRKYQRP